MTDVKGSILGNAVLRREDPTLLTGEDKYFDDMEIDGLGFVYFARSPVAHANILSIDTTEAKEVEGVVGVWTADDLELSPYLAFPLFPPQFLFQTNHRPFCFCFLLFLSYFVLSFFVLIRPCLIVVIFSFYIPFFSSSSPSHSIFCQIQNSSHYCVQK